MRNSSVSQHVSIWPLTRLETAMFLLAATLWAAAGVMWAASEPGLLGDVGHQLEDLISRQR
jgi:hypothetical protein